MSVRTVTKKIAIIIQGDSSSLTGAKHTENARLSSLTLANEGYDIVLMNPGETPSDIMSQITSTANTLGERDELVVYTTGHGRLNNSTASLIVGSQELPMDLFCSGLRNSKAQITVVMDQCYSSNFGMSLTSFDNLRFIGLSGKNLTDSCRPFAKCFWSANIGKTPEADYDHDGKISWQERFRWATTDCEAEKNNDKTTEYSLATYFAGKNIGERPFNEKPIAHVTTQAELDNELGELDAGQYAIVLFSAPWCSACQKIKPLFSKWATGEYKFIIAEHTEPTAQFPAINISSLPDSRLFGTGIRPQGFNIRVDEVGNINDMVRYFIANRNPEQIANHWWNNGTPSQRAVAYNILTRLEPEKKRGLFLLAIHDKADEVRNAAVESIVGWNQPERNNNAILIPYLIGALSDSAPLVRASAAGSIASFHEKANKAVPRLAELLADPDAEVVVKASYALMKMKKSAAPVVSQAIEALQRKNNTYANMCLVRVIENNTELLNKSHIPALLRAMETNDSETVLTDLARVIIELGPSVLEQKSMISRLIKCINSSDAVVRFYAFAMIEETAPEARAFFPDLDRKMKEFFTSTPWH